MKSSDAIAKILEANKVSVAFELIGGMITHLIDSIGTHGYTKVISMRHEQGAAFAAGGASRAFDNGNIAVALGTSGPGATNLITGIADCWLDNVPCLFITGQVNTNEQKGDLAIRQQGFQELDIVSIVSSITKLAIKIESVEQIIPVLQKAIDLSKSGRPGPCLVDIPMNLQRAEISSDLVEQHINNIRLQSCKSAQVVELIKDEEQQLEMLISKSIKPLILFGGGVRYSKQIDNFIHTLNEKKICYDM